MVKITFKPTNQQTFEENFDVNVTKTILDVKARIGQRLNVTGDKIKLIHKGKILKDQQFLNTMGLGEVETFHLVVKKDEAPQGSTGGFNTGAQGTGTGGIGGGFGGMGGAGGFGGLGGMGGMGGGLGGLGGMNPNDLSSMISGLDPQMMQQMISSNPMLSNIANSNPQLKAMLSNPQLLKQMMSPQMIQMAMSQMGSMGGLGGMGGFGGFGQGQAAQGTQGQQGQQGMPNYNQMMNMMGGLGLGGAGFGGVQQPPAGTDLKVFYKDQLKQLADMGFPNQTANIDILKQTGGNVELAVQRLIGGM